MKVHLVFESVHPREIWQRRDGLCGILTAKISHLADDTTSPASSSHVEKEIIIGRTRCRLIGVFFCQNDVPSFRENSRSFSDTTSLELIGDGMCAFET